MNICLLQDIKLCPGKSNITVFDFFCRFLRAPELLALSHTCKHFHATLKVTTWYHDLWHRQRRVMQACLSNDAVLLARCVRTSADIIPIKHVICHYDLLDVAMCVLKRDGEREEAVALQMLFDVYTGNMRKIDIRHQDALLMYSCIYDIHEIVKHCISSIHRKARHQFALYLQNVAFWNGSWRCFDLLNVVVTRDSHMHTHPQNKVRVRTPEALSRLRKQAVKRNVDVFFKESEWCLMAIMCNHYDMYLEYVAHLTSLAHASETYSTLEFALCDDMDIIGHWYENAVPFGIHEEQFRKHMKQRKANKHVQRALRRQRDKMRHRSKTYLKTLGTILILFVTVLLITMFIMF